MATAGTHKYPIVMPKLTRKPRIIPEGHSSGSTSRRRMSQKSSNSNSNHGRVPSQGSNLCFVFISLLQLTLGILGLGLFQGLDDDGNLGRHLFCQSQSWRLEYNFNLTCQIFLASTLLLKSKGFEKNSILLKGWIFLGIVVAVVSLLSGCCQVSSQSASSAPNKIEIPFLFLSTGVNMIQTMVVFTCYFGDAVFALNEPIE